MRWLLFALILFIGLAQSQEPTKSQPNAQKAAQKASADQRGTESLPLVVKAQEAEKTTERVAQDRQENEEKAGRENRLVLWTLILAVLTGVLAIVAFGQLVMFYLQLRLMKSGTEDTKNLALAAQSGADAAKIQSEAVMLAERAYVKMSHVPAGVYWSKTSEKTFMVDIQVLNYGRTPTNVTDVVLCMKVLPNEESLPRIPDYFIKPSREEIPGGFLMPDDFFIQTFNFGLGDKLEAVKDKASKIWIIGYVDYIDVFKKRHRGGYARVYNRWLDDGKQNNLVLVTQAGYNYDRQREKEEGNDW